MLMLTCDRIDWWGIVVIRSTIAVVVGWVTVSILGIMIMIGLVLVTVAHLSLTLPVVK
jgi:hypothetical protein